MIWAAPYSSTELTEELESSVIHNSVTSVIFTETQVQTPKVPLPLIFNTWR